MRPFLLPAVLALAMSFCRWCAARPDGQEKSAKAALASNKPGQSKGAPDYWTSFIDVSYDEEGDEVERLRFGKTESGRYGNRNVDEVAGIAVELVSSVDGSPTGCDPPFVPVYPKGESWIAVVVWGGACDVDRKVLNAFAANASGILVYHDVSNGALQPSTASSGQRLPIPLVFTYAGKGKEITNLIRTRKTVRISLSRASYCRLEARQLPVGHVAAGEGEGGVGGSGGKVVNIRYCFPPEGWDEMQQLLHTTQESYMNISENGGSLYEAEKRTSVLFVSISFLVLVLISLAWLVFYYVQRFRYYQEKDLMERELCCQARRALAIISTAVLKSEDLANKESSDPCAVCIETFLEDDVVRILPCKHQFHKVCIDQWLMDKRTCPMCKMDILKHYGFLEEESRSDDRPGSSEDVV